MAGSDPEIPTRGASPTEGEVGAIAGSLDWDVVSCRARLGPSADLARPTSSTVFIRPKYPRHTASLGSGSRRGSGAASADPLSRR